MCSNPPKSDTFNLKEHFVEGNINLKFDYFSDGTILQAHLFGAACGKKSFFERIHSFSLILEDIQFS